MRVLFLTHSYPRYAGDPPGSFLLALARALRGESVSVHVVAPAAEGLTTSETLEGIPVTRFRYAPRRYETLAYTGTMAETATKSWSGRLAMLSFLGTEFVAGLRERRLFRPDVIHAHWWFPGGFVGAWTSVCTHIPLVTTVHGTDVRILRSASIVRPLARRVLKRSAAVTTVSHWLAREVHDLLRGDEPLVAPMPVATELFTPAGVREHNRLLFVGRLNEQKGIKYAICAVAALQTPAVLDVIGAGPALDACRTLAHTLGISDRVFFHGQLSQRELPPFYRRAAAVVIPSVDEGLGLVAVEALLCETPVVAFASGGLPDVIQHGHTGFLVPPKDVTALASTLDDLLSNPASGRECGHAGRLYATATFSPEAVARRYAGIYKDTLQRRAA